MDLPYYHGPLTKRECEILLLTAGGDGNFLLRDSESVPGVLCLCVSFKNFVYTYRIFRERHGNYKIQTLEGTPKQIFPNLKELISKFEKPDQGLVVHLSNPIKRTSPSWRWRRLQVELNGIYEQTSDVLSLMKVQVSMVNAEFGAGNSKAWVIKEPPILPGKLWSPQPWKMSL